METCKHTMHTTFEPYPALRSERNWVLTLVCNTHGFIHSMLRDDLRYYRDTENPLYLAWNRHLNEHSRPQGHNPVIRMM